jgi:hypothetical protein
MLGIIGTLIALIRNRQPSEYKVNEYENTMQEIVSNIHYLPNNWVSLAHTPKVYKEFTKLFSYQIYNWLDELQGLLLCPYVFGINLANDSHKLINFMQKNTTFCEKIGYVYTKSMFENSNSDDRNLEDNTPSLNSEDSRKLQMSIINFQQNYPRCHKLLHTTMDEHLSKTFGDFTIKHHTNNISPFQQQDDLFTDIETVGNTFNDIMDDIDKLVDEET